MWGTLRREGIISVANQMIRVHLTKKVIFGEDLKEDLCRWREEQCKIPAIDRNMPGVNMKEATKAGFAKGEEEKSQR